MMDKYGFLFARAIVALSEAKLLCFPLQLMPGERQLSADEIARAVLNGTHLMRQACIMSDMEEVLPELDRLDGMFAPPAPVFPIEGRLAIAQAIVHLISRVQDDLQQQFFFHLTQQDVRFYGEKALFGEIVAKTFKEAADDIERAGNCFALQQPTACVFHLMRAMEVAVRQLSKRLKVTITPQTTWRQMTGNMDPKIKVMPDATQRQKQKKNDWESARANLHHVGSVCATTRCILPRLTRSHRRLTLSMPYVCLCPVLPFFNTLGDNFFERLLKIFRVIRSFYFARHSEEALVALGIGEFWL